MFNLLIRTLLRLADFCKETGIYLIVDEVQTGLGQYWCFMLMSTTILNQISLLWQRFGKWVPVGAMLAKSSLGAAISYGSHGSTFEEINLVMAAARSYA